MHLGGWVAEALHYGDAIPDWPDLDQTRDFLVAANIPAAEIEATIDDLRGQVEALLRSPWGRRRVQLLTTALLRFGTITGDAIRYAERCEAARRCEAASRRTRDRLAEVGSRSSQPRPRKKICGGACPLAARRVEASNAIVSRMSGAVPGSGGAASPRVEAPPSSTKGAVEWRRKAYHLCQVFSFRHPSVTLKTRAISFSLIMPHRPP